jgi:hypothetical protein
MSLEENLQKYELPSTTSDIGYVDSAIGFIERTKSNKNLKKCVMKITYIALAYVFIIAVNYHLSNKAKY